MSMDTKETLERDVAFTLDRMTEGSQEGDGKDKALGRSIVCLTIAVKEAGYTTHAGDIEERARGFRYIASAVCLGK